MPSDAETFEIGFQTPIPPPNTHRVPLFVQEPSPGHGALVSPMPNTGVKYGTNRMPSRPPSPTDSVTGAPTPSAIAELSPGLTCAYPRSPLIAMLSVEPCPTASPASYTRTSPPIPSSIAAAQLVQSPKLT